MLYLFAAFAHAVDVPDTTSPEEGPGRPVVGIGAGIRGETGEAGLVTSVRLRAAPWLVVDPMVYVMNNTSVTTIETSSEVEGAEATTEETSNGETRLYGAVALRFRVAEGKRASAWLLATGGLLRADATGAETGVIGAADTDRLQVLSGNAGLGASGELWLRPELTLSADAGFTLFEAGRIVYEVGSADSVTDFSRFQLTPFAQLAIHLYL